MTSGGSDPKTLAKCKNGTSVAMPRLVKIVRRTSAVDEKVWCFFRLSRFWN